MIEAYITMPGRAPTTMGKYRRPWIAKNHTVPCTTMERSSSRVITTTNTNNRMKQVT